MTAIVLVHGGAGTVADELFDAAASGTARAAELAREVLLRGDDAVAAAVAAVRSMEDDPTFNAGLGACMNGDGQFEVDAGIMRASDRRAAGLGAVPNLGDAINVARALLDDGRHALLVGQGATRFARECGVGEFGREACWTQKAQDRFEAARRGEMAKENRADTVGAVVLDAKGELVAAGSTGGVLLKMPGRVGDTPLIGAGYFADPELGAACATGVGEAIMHSMMAYELLSRARVGGSLQEHAQRLCDEVRDRSGAAVGLIAIRPDGETAIAHASDHMSWALACGDEPVRGDLVHPKS